MLTELAKRSAAVRRAAARLEKLTADRDALIREAARTRSLRSVAADAGISFQRAAQIVQAKR